MANSTIDQDTNQSTGFGGQPPQTEDIQNPFPGGEPPEDDQEKRGDQESLSDRIKNGYNTAQNIKKLTGAKEAAEAGEGAEAAAGAEGAAGAAEGAASTAEGAAATEGALGASAAGAETAGAAAATEGAGALGAAGASAGAAGAGAAGSAAATAGAAVAAEGATVTAVGVGATPVGWIAAGIGIVLLLIIIIVFFFKGSPSTSTQTQLQQQTNTGTGTGGTAICGGAGGGSTTSTGSLDYTLPLKDVSVLPQNVNQIQDQVAAQWPNAHLYDWDHVVDAAVRAGWNPSLILALWIEESGAQGASGYTDALGCDPSNPTTDINKSLNCVFNSFRAYNNFEDFMCVYGGDGFHKAPCTFNTQNPNFPGNIKNWYTKLTGGTGDNGNNTTTPIACSPGAPRDWPAAGLISQGPQGATDHARLATYGWNAIDIAGIMGEPIKSAFDGTVTAVHDCIADGDCSAGYNGFGNSVEITTNTDKGSFIALYGHLAEIDTTLNASVKAGDTIGIMGTTGHSTGIHLHYQFMGAEMAPPNIPEAIVPLDCDSTSDCSPNPVVPGSAKPTPAL
ncbi:MAG TPA: M23 family metallopeptidase [Patescibacteria group bacterium]|nr:M23 family metallopeptidase [Patescibacteria group bacterium]